ncbi:DUF3617 domain-containing protein [Novosphingobium sp. 9]|uniref:DUF3617 domain-containing protein n=1 Tax=Novosphingobium sp. 9 TaxID=2025349 RepID=UPI0021B50C0F|nr:DUF3617 family protein [Novosphingobium sp. 9]
MTLGRLAALGSVCAVMAGSALVAAVPAGAMLDELTSGNWELRERGASAPVRQLCLDSGRELIQMRHAGMACSRTVVQDTPQEVTVQYTCPGQGYGRTHIRRESNSLIQIDSQGIAKGQPFSFTMEGRRTGDCAK